MSRVSAAVRRWAGPGLAIRFAVADLVHDRLLTVIGIVLLAALIAPPVVLHTLRVGLVETWAEDLARDIRNREVVIVGENRITADDLAVIAAWPQTGFVVPEPSFFVSTQRARKAKSRGVVIDLNLRTTDLDDPVMAGVYDSAIAPQVAVLSARAAARLDVAQGDSITLLLARTPADSNPVRVPVTLEVAAVLPAERWAGEDAFVAPATLLGFRDWLTFASDDPGLVPDPATVIWQSLRIYAPKVADATALRDRLDLFGLETRLMTDQVDRILKLETGLRQIFTIVLILSTTAFVITAFLLQWLSVVRKKRDFALMSVIGMPPAQVAVFPAFQGGVMTAVACCIAAALVVGLQGPVETIVQGYLTTPSAVQAPALTPLAGGFLAAIVIGALAGIAAVMTLRPEDFSHALRGD